ncbi:MAG: SUMF1/EgtB/PvdO family nonheme iron enzyme [Candidatus Lernaella stagnicola]|nr:SUMF1/EgtB/PvdO family nonheme iron enzyme [Candidatus Lernaella stagnicola]
MPYHRYIVVALTVLLCASILVNCGPEERPDGNEEDSQEEFDREIGNSPMVLIPAGPFGMSCTDPDNGLCGVFYHVVDLPDFYIDVYEASVGDLYKCIEAGGCAERKAQYWADVSDRHPAYSINWYDAGDYCAWAGKRLPTSAEWEKAARGDRDGHNYPWGDEFHPTWANWCDGEGCDGSVDGYTGSAPVDAFPENVSPYGVYNMCGNIMEWTTTPSSTFVGSYVLRGGGYEPDNGMGEPPIMRCWRGWKSAIRLPLTRRISVFAV